MWSSTIPLIKMQFWSPSLHLMLTTRQYLKCRYLVIKQPKWLNNSASLRFGRFEGHLNCKCAAASLIFLFPQFHGKGLCPRVLSMALGRRSSTWIQAMMVQNWPGFSSAAHLESVMTRSFSQFSKKIFSFSQPWHVNQRKWWPGCLVLGIMTESWHQ